MATKTDRMDEAMENTDKYWDKIGPVSTSLIGLSPELALKSAADIAVYHYISEQQEIEDAE